MLSYLSDIPQQARALTAIGDLTAKAVHDLYHAPQGSLFPPEDNPDLGDLADALRKRKWSDIEAAELITAYKRAVALGRSIEVRAITRLVLAHENDGPAQAVIDCMEVEPPEGVDIIKVLSRKGSQKIVFLASWRLRQQEVVLKKVIGSAESVERIISRELQPHPLSMVHPNIIETHILKNRSGESFLVERRLQVVLSDKWQAEGVHEAANLLFDIAKALRFLHENQKKVHGDVKPDNIGRRENSYVLLDFGICRPVEEFSRESTPTGSIRTRAPELLNDKAYIEPEKADIWALGATVFNALLGRFPLIQGDEAIPRISTPEQRGEFEARIAQRAIHEWNKWVVVDQIPEPLRGVMERMLERDVRKRISASELVPLSEARLSAFLRSPVQPFSLSGRFSPMEELGQIREFLLAQRNLSILPANRRQQLGERLKELKRVSGFDQPKQEEIDLLIDRLN